MEQESYPDPLEALNLTKTTIELLQTKHEDVFKTQPTDEPAKTHKPEVDHGGPPYCSFCGKSSKAVQKIIAGPNVFICNECVRLCLGIINEEASQAESK